MRISREVCQTLPVCYIYSDLVVECVECMANSDNVIRAGLTPKLRDIPALVSGLTYIAGDPKKHVVKHRDFPPSIPRTSIVPSVLYDPPIPEFSVIQTKLYPDRTEKHRAVRGPSIAIVTGGKGWISWKKQDQEKLEVGLGDVFFVGANTEITVESEGNTVLVIYRAFVEGD